MTAFGAHSIAAGMGAQSENIGLTLLGLGVLLAAYDISEVFLKPVFGALSDRIGTKPVIVAGLLAFAVLSLPGLWGRDPLMLGIARLGQGAAASAFSPAASAMVARLAAGRNAGSRFGKYGSWKSLGYVIGPMLGAGLIFAGGFALLFATLSALAIAAALWVLLGVPHLAPLPASATPSSTSSGRSPNGASWSPRWSSRPRWRPWARQSDSSPPWQPGTALAPLRVPRRSACWPSHRC